jgi:serine/threonine-protein kinase
MAPEQTKSQPLDRRTDVFSAGIVLYEAITNERVVRADNDGDILLGMLLGDFDPPTRWVSDLPPELAAVTMKALELDRDDRFSTAAEFAEALEHSVTVAPTREVARFVNEHGGEMIAERRARLRSLGRTPASIRPPPPNAEAAPTMLEPVRARAGNRRRVIAGLLLFLLASAALFLGWHFTGKNSAAASAPVASSSASADLAPTPSTPDTISSALAPTTHPPIIGSPKKHGSNHAGHPHPNPCDPPYDVLPDGTHRFKPQCVQ